MGKYLKYVIVTILILGLAIVGKDQYEKKLMEEANYGMPALIKQMEVDNLFIGSSMFRQGIDIETLNETGASNYILAYNGNQPVLEDWILCYLIDNGLIINNLYVDMYVYSAYESPELSDEKILMEVGLQAKNNIWNIYSTECGYGLDDWWRFFISGNNEILLTWPIHYKMVNGMFQSGGKTNYSEGISEESIAKLSVPKVNGDLNDIQKDSIIDMISICRDNGIKIIFIETPKYIEVLEDETYVNAINEYADLLKEYSTDYVLSNDICGSELSIDSYNFIDMIHLSSKGMKTYTKYLIDNIMSDR